MVNAYTVGQINKYIRDMFRQDYMLRHLYVKGEVSNCKYHTSGHIYFSLKDETGTISCVMFAGKRGGLAFSMKDGQQVTVLGTIDVYGRDGKYELYAEQILQEGSGLLYEKFLKTKADLAERGMFAPEYKKPIPPYCFRIGVVTAPTGAAVHDIQSISARRNPYVQLILCPVLVQGEGASKSIADGIRRAALQNVDVIIVGRGGGSIEDLWAFNEETVAQAIFESPVPVISAVGHETDTTIADYVADLRAPTPSAAAELAVFDYREFQDALSSYRQRYQNDMKHAVLAGREKTGRYERRLLSLSPESQLRMKQQYLDKLEDDFRRNMEDKVSSERRSAAERSDLLHRMILERIRTAEYRYGMITEKYSGISPLRRLKQGFVYTELDSGRALNSVRQVKKRDGLLIHVTDGTVSAEVTAVKEGRDDCKEE